MNALVLTAGLGTRLDPLTRLVAKPAVPIGDRSLVEHVLDWVRRQGVVDVVMNLYHHPSTLTAIVGDGRHLGVRVRYSWEQPVLGSAGGPRKALPLIDSDPFLIVNGDTLCDFDLAAMADAHQIAGADVTLAVVPNPDPEHYNGILADSDGRITGFVPRGRAHGSWHFVGVQIAQKRVFAELPAGVIIETIAGIYRDIVAAHPGRLRIWSAATTFLDVGTPRDYLAASEHLPADYRHPIAALSHDEGLPPHVTRSIVWPESSVAQDAVLDRCVVAGQVRIPSGFRAESSVLVPAAILRPTDAVDVRDGVAIFPI
jgi:NDP-sugar pyrophosphorylase family protein